MGYAETHPVCAESSYAYQGYAGYCKESRCDTAIPVGGVTGYMNTDPTMRALMAAVNEGPVSVAIEADQMSFQLYSSGVLTGVGGINLDHGVLVVGYGTSTGGLDYWKVKNSWGTSFGERGYIRIEKRKNAHGECSILMGASYPVVDGDMSVVKQVVV